MPFMMKMMTMGPGAGDPSNLYIPTIFTSQLGSRNSVPGRSMTLGLFRQVDRRTWAGPMEDGDESARVAQLVIRAARPEMFPVMEDWQVADHFGQTGVDQKNALDGEFGVSNLEMVAVLNE
jgi:hypothetical protein